MSLKLPIDIIKKIKSYNEEPFRLPKIFHDSDNPNHGLVSNGKVLLRPLEDQDKYLEDSEWSLPAFIFKKNHERGRKTHSYPMINHLKTKYTASDNGIRWFLRSDFLKNIKKVYRNYTDKYTSNPNIIKQYLSSDEIDHRPNRPKPVIRSMTNKYLTYRSGEIVKYYTNFFDPKKYIYVKGYLDISMDNNEIVTFTTFRTRYLPIQTLSLTRKDILRNISKLNSNIYDPCRDITYIDILIKNKICTIKIKQPIEKTVSKLKALGLLFTNGYLTKDNDYYIYLRSYNPKDSVYLETDLNVYGIVRYISCYFMSSNLNRYCYNIISIDPLEPKVVTYIDRLQKDYGPYDYDSDGDSYYDNE
jgi:hypothetical protein